jgi:hypothetical protein
MGTQKSDPTRDPKFRQVVQTFLHTKPQPHKPIGKRARPKRRKRQAKKE